MSIGTSQPTRRSPNRTGGAESSTEKVSHGANEVRHSRAFHVFARCGLLARAVVYLVLGGLVLQTAANGRGSSRTDAQGAFAEVGRQPAGTEILIVLTIGLVAYAVWRFVEALSRRPQGQDVSVWTRIGWCAAGGVYVVLCVNVVGIIGGAGSNQGPERHPTSFTADVLRAPTGPVLLGVIATAIAGGGIGLIVWGLRHDYDEELERAGMTHRQRTLTRWSGMIGNAARGVAVLVVACSLFNSAVTNDPDHAKSLDTGLHSLAGNPLGIVLLVLVGTGFVAFGIHSVLEARHRRI